jgi:cation diffusion facilitator CzcD-associated flavoprotein CzcO
VPYTNENCFDVTIFEKQSHVAGIWNLNRLTPIYEGLETNVPRTMMEYKDFPYLPKTSLFPTHEKVEKYLESYSSDIRDCINLNSEVTMLTKVTNHDHEKWKLKITDTSTCSSRKVENFFDAIVVATGTFDTIHVPAEVAWTAWEKEYPGSVIHSKAYSNVRKFEGKVSYFFLLRDSSCKLGISLSV